MNKYKKNNIVLGYFFTTSLILQFYLSYGINGATPISSVGGGSHCLLFYTGGSNLFQSDIYSEFIHAVEKEEIDVYDIPFNYQLLQQDVDFLKSKYNYDYQSINVLGHSSGCTTLLNQCGELHGVNNVFLFDPVKTKFFNHDKWSCKNYDSLSFIHAAKTYKINSDPFGLPFIPIFKLTIEHLDVVGPNIDEINIKEHGHSDILNKKLANFMHNTRISVGNKNRDTTTRNKYFDTILNVLLKVMKETEHKNQL